jgi:Uncharacterized conserved protein
MQMSAREKLVRDKIPELYAEGTYRVARPDEYAALLRDKLVEETGEYLAARDPEELADVLEVVRALARTHGLDLADLERLRAEKAARRGGFAGGVVLRETRPVRHSARAVLLDGDDLILFRRVRPDRPEPYWVTPGGTVEPGDASPEAALRRELDEELGATAGPAMPLMVVTEYGARHWFFACRLRTLDISRRSGPEFGDPAQGSHEIVRVPCTPDAIGAINLVPPRLADFLAANAAALPDLVDAATYAPGRYRPVVDVHLLVLDGDRILLGRRRDTGYADGEWQIMPSGHLDEGESVVDAVIREAKEELGLHVAPADIEPAHVLHHRNPGGTARVGFFFVARRPLGEPVNAEPHKCAELAWFPVDDLPADIVPYAAAGVRASLAGAAFSLHGWRDPSPAELRAEAVRAGYEELSVAVVAHRDDSVLVLSDDHSDRLPETLVRPGEPLDHAAARLLPGPARYLTAEDYVSPTGTQARRFAFAVPLPPDAPLPSNGRLLPADLDGSSRLTAAQRRFVHAWRTSG